jgi:putative endonuclease
MKQLHVYLLLCNDNSIYVGITNNIERRLNEHQSGYNKNSYTSSRLPVKLIYVQSFKNFLEGIAYEKKLKKWSHDKKMALAMNDIELLKQLAECKNETSHKHYIKDDKDISF